MNEKLIGMDGGMLKQPIYNVFMGQGGFSALLPLTLLYTFSCSRHLRHIGKSTIIPALFNVPYPLLFAAPVLFNPIYLVPFILYPAASTVINYYVLSSEILTVTVEATGIMPVILSGYFFTAGEVLGILLQVLNFMLASLIYYPFFRYHESRLMASYEPRSRMKAAEQSLGRRVKKYSPKLWNKLLPPSLKKGRPLQ